MNLGICWSSSLFHHAHHRPTQPNKTIILPVRNGRSGTFIWSRWADQSSDFLWQKHRPVRFYNNNMFTNDTVPVGCQVASNKEPTVGYFLSTALNYHGQEQYCYPLWSIYSYNHRQPKLFVHEIGFFIFFLVRKSCFTFFSASSKSVSIQPSPLSVVFKNCTPSSNKRRVRSLVFVTRAYLGCYFVLSAWATCYLYRH